MHAGIILLRPGDGGLQYFPIRTGWPENIGICSSMPWIMCSRGSSRFREPGWSAVKHYIPVDLTFLLWLSSLHESLFEPRPCHGERTGFHISFWQAGSVQPAGLYDNSLKTAGIALLECRVLIYCCGWQVWSSHADSIEMTRHGQGPFPQPFGRSSVPGVQRKPQRDTQQ